MGGGRRLFENLVVFVFESVVWSVGLLVFAGVLVLLGGFQW